MTKHHCNCPRQQVPFSMWIIYNVVTILFLQHVTDALTGPSNSCVHRSYIQMIHSQRYNTKLHCRQGISILQQHSISKNHGIDHRYIFSPTSSSRYSFRSTVLNMGLYDKPLPPRPSPREDPTNKDDDVYDDDEDIDEYVEDDDDYVAERLFEFNMNGKEINDLLPSLRRRLTTGVECYYVPTDRIVQNLVDKTSVNYIDACWALEACQGDITEAWTRISVARRLQLNQSRQKQIIDDDSEFDEDDYEIELEDEYTSRKNNIEAQERKRKLDLYNQPSKPDDRWLPKENPRPIDDEPWFTG
jgi:hypothetical protein